MGFFVSLVPGRAALLAGDLRCLSLVWLAAVLREEEVGSEREPLVPEGLGELGPALRTFGELAQPDADALALAAEQSRPLRPEATPYPMQAWIQSLPPSLKDQLLLQALQGQGEAVSGHLRRHLHAARQTPASTTGRTATQLVERHTRLALVREEAAKRAEAAEADRREARRKAEREAEVDRIEERLVQTRAQVDGEIRRRNARACERAELLLTDLAAVAQRRGDLTGWRRRVQALMVTHAAKRTFCDRLHGLLQAHPDGLLRPQS